jgi:hypothetical protein
MALDPWFLHWTGMYDVAASTLGVVGAACAMKGVRLHLVGAAALALFLSGVFDLSTDGSFFGGLCIFFFAGLGWALAVNPSSMVKRPGDAVYWDEVVSGVHGTIPGRGIEESYVPVPSRMLAREPGRGRRIIAMNLLGVASVVLLVEACLAISLSLWYHPYEAYLDVDWGLLLIGVYEACASMVGLYGTYMIHKGRSPVVQVGAALMVFSSGAFLLLPWFWITVLLPMIAMLLSFVVMFMLILGSTMKGPDPSVRYGKGGGPMMGRPPRDTKTEDGREGGG